MPQKCGQTHRRSKFTASQQSKSYIDKKEDKVIWEEES
jgi:hypothetical protein